MKKLIIKSYGILISVGFLFMLAGRYYPDETARDNYIAAGIYIVACVFFFTCSNWCYFITFKKEMIDNLIGK